MLNGDISELINIGGKRKTQSEFESWDAIVFNLDMSFGNFSKLQCEFFILYANFYSE